jgi:hypothetical protein
MFSKAYASEYGTPLASTFRLMISKGWHNNYLEASLTPTSQRINTDQPLPNHATLRRANILSTLHHRLLYITSFEVIQGITTTTRRIPGRSRSNSTYSYSLASTNGYCMRTLTQDRSTLLSRLSTLIRILRAERPRRKELRTEMTGVLWARGD